MSGPIRLTEVCAFTGYTVANVEHLTRDRADLWDTDHTDLTSEGVVFVFDHYRLSEERVVEFRAMMAPLLAHVVKAIEEQEKES